jgi:hypothetical protein
VWRARRDSNNHTKVLIFKDIELWIQRGVSGAVTQRSLDWFTDLIGWRGSTRTCNHTVMSGSISTSFVDFTAFSSAFEHVRRVLVRLFLVRNWCGEAPPDAIQNRSSSGGDRLVKLPNIAPF